MPRMGLPRFRKASNRGFSKAVRSGRGLTESFSYTHDAKGNITSIVDSTGHVTTISGVDL